MATHRSCSSLRDTLASETAEEAAPVNPLAGPIQRYVRTAHVLLGVLPLPWVLRGLDDQEVIPGERREHGDALVRLLTTAACASAHWGYVSAYPWRRMPLSRLALADDPSASSRYMTSKSNQIASRGTNSRRNTSARANVRGKRSARSTTARTGQASKRNWGVDISVSIIDRCVVS